MTPLSAAFSFSLPFALTFFLAPSEDLATLRFFEGPYVQSQRGMQGMMNVHSLPLAEQHAFSRF